MDKTNETTVKTEVIGDPNAPVLDHSKEIKVMGLTLKREHDVDSKAVVNSNPNFKILREIMETHSDVKEAIESALKWFDEILILNCVERAYNSLTVATKEHRNMDIRKIGEFIDLVANAIDADPILKSTVENATKHKHNLRWWASSTACGYVLQMTSRYEVVK